MMQLDMFLDQTDLVTPPINRHLELEAEISLLTRRFWKQIEVDTVGSALIKHDIISAGRKLYLADRYHIYCLQHQEITEGFETTAENRQLVVYAKDESQALEFYEMANVCYQLSGWQDNPHYYSEPEFIDPPEHLLKESQR